MSVPAPHERLNQPGALLSRSDLRDLGLERRAVDAVFRACPVVSLPGYARPLDAGVSGAHKSSAPDRLGGFWNAWFSRRELDAAHALAATASEQECEEELARLERVRQGRLDAWRWTQ